jgi:glycosyl transferase family 2
VIVNTDADHQYRASDIPKLVEPILAGRADMVVGDRQIKEVEHFSASKRSLQRLGSWVVRRASGTEVPDTTSGFRAYNREAALQLQVVSNYTYTLESLIQAGKMLVAVEHVPIRSNPELRESRLVDSTPAYVRRNALAVFRAYVLYEPLRVFTVVACAFGIAAVVAWTPFMLDWILNGDRSGHVQSLILGAVLALISVQMFGLGVVGDAIAGQRVIAQRTFERVRRLELEAGIEPSHYEAGRPAGGGAAAENGLRRRDGARAEHSGGVGG